MLTLPLAFSLAMLGETSYAGHGSAQKLPPPQTGMHLAPEPNSAAQSALLPQPVLGLLGSVKPLMQKPSPSVVLKQVQHCSGVGQQIIVASHVLAHRQVEAGLASSHSPPLL